MHANSSAYSDPATRRGWRRTMLFRLTAFLLSLGSLVGWLYVCLMTPVWTLWLLIPLLLVLVHIALVTRGCCCRR
ncbi:MAG: hypothetical protein ACRDT8_08700 [Micromonosporaceae bacterium]